MTTLLLLQRALRVDDNPALNRVAGAEPLIIASPEALSASTPLADASSWQASGHGLRFRRQCLADLKAALQRHQHTLVALEDDRIGTLLDFLTRHHITRLVMDRHPDPQWQRTFEQRLVQTMPRLRIEAIDCNSLFSAAEAGVDADSLPQVFSQFRRHLERRALRVALPPAAPPVALPDGCTTTDRFSGGEQAGLAHLHCYLFVDRHVSHYKDTRNGLLNDSDGSRLSVWLAHGALSPRRIWSELDRYVALYGEDKHSTWLRVELWWREFFRLNLALKGTAIYLREAALPTLSGDARQRLQRWQQGRTGVPFVDANMIELLRTGFMSNRGRQNVASYLIHDLQVHWLYGAAWFEQQLIDFDLASNLGNWAYIAGCGHDVRPCRRFNIEKQAREYDPDGAYVRHWLTSADVS